MCSGFGVGLCMAVAVTVGAIEPFSFEFHNSANSSGWLEFVDVRGF